MIITILTGQRPKLLQDTIESVLQHVPELFEHRVVVFNNAGDKPTTELLNTYNFIDDIITNQGTLPIGAAISLLASKAYESGERFWCLLEDDWAAQSGGWVEQAIDLLKNPEVSQVRLRLESEPVLKNHMITGEPIVWVEEKGYKITEKAHMTFNPSIIKTVDIPLIFPCTGERDAQKNWLYRNMGEVVQLVPGVFKHIGDDNSLRLKTNCEV